MLILNTKYLKVDCVPQKYDCEVDLGISRMMWASGYKLRGVRVFLPWSCYDIVFGKDVLGFYN